MFRTVKASVNRPYGIAIYGDCIYIACKDGLLELHADRPRRVIAAGIFGQRPQGISFDDAGDFYVTDPFLNRVLKFNLNGSYEPLDIPGLQHPYSVAAWDNSVYVNDHQRGLLLKYTDGVTETVCESLFQPHDMFALWDGTLLMTDNNQRLVSITQRGQVSTLFQTRTARYLCGVGVDDQTIYVTQSHANALWRHDQRGVFVAQLAPRIYMPYGVASHNSVLYICDHGHNRIMSLLDSDLTWLHPDDFEPSPVNIHCDLGADSSQ